MIDRRRFLSQTGLLIAGSGLMPLIFSRGIWAAPVADARKGKVLVLIIQRGAMDGLSIVPPVGDGFYFESRPHIGLPRQGEGSALRLDGHFGLHPSMAALKPLWENGSLAFVHQAGSPDHSRSHFDAQDFFETGTPGNKNTADGFLNRLLALNPGPSSAVRAVAMQPSMPRVLQGPFPAVSMASLEEYRIRSREGEGFESMYQGATDQVFRGVAHEAFDGLHTVEKLKGSKPLSEDLYPKKNPFARKLGEIARLIHAEVGLQVAVTESGGWDTHINQGSQNGQLSDRLRELAEGLSAFSRDLGPKMADVCVVCVTEFGRTVRENGTRGTDHGHGSVMTVLGGPVAGGKVHGQWKDLKPANLFEGRDLPVTTDVRDVLAEVLTRHLGMKGMERVFPKYAFGAVPGVLRG